MGEGADRRGVALVFGLALLLRAPRLWARWDEVALAYAAYAEPTVAALQRLDLPAALTTWMGLHPPLWPLVHAALELALPVPLVWMGASALASAGAAALVARAGGVVPGLVLATAPLQVAYAAEVHNYPLAVLLVAACLALARAPWAALAAVAVLAGWTHLLAGAAGCGVVIWRSWRAPRPEAARLLAATALGLLPMAAGALRKMGEDGTFAQPDASLSAWVDLVAQSVGWPGVAIGVVAVVGLRREALAAALPVAGVLAFALLSGAAAPHQRPYLLLLAPPLALAVGETARRWGRPIALGVGALCLGRAAWGLADSAATLAALSADQQADRAIDRAVAASAPGDVLWLVSPALQADDDKTATAPVLWRLGPAAWMPLARPVDFEYADWRYGQPRGWRGRVVHTSTELYAAPFDHAVGPALEAGHAVFVVLYDHGPAMGLLDRVGRVVRPYAVETLTLPRDTGLGDDHLFRLTAP